MFGKSKWFERRKYGGWGLTPKTWQGWAYVSVLILSLVAIQLVGSLDTKGRITVTVIWATILIIDTFDMMVRLKKDEREHIHEALSERNASWFMMMILLVGFLYYFVSNILDGSLYVEPFITLALFGGMIIKSVTNLYLERED